MLVVNENNDIEVYNIVPVYRGNRVVKILTSVSMQDIIDIFERLEYDPETQRGIRDKKYKNKVVQEKFESKINIEEMKYKIMNEFFDGNTLSWNVRIGQVGDEKTAYEFVPEENKIIIKSKRITIPDSWHRHRAIYALKDYSQSINLKDYCFPLSICLYTLVEEQCLFSELNTTGTKASKSRGLYLSNSYKTILLKEIIKESPLKDNVETVTDFVWRKNKSVAFSTLYGSLFDKRFGAYKTIKEEEVDDFKNWMIRFYTHLIKVRPELGKVSDDERNYLFANSMISSTPAWTAYALIARALYGDTNWKRKLQRLNSTYKAGSWEGDLLSLDNPLWHGTVCMMDKKGKWKLTSNRRTQVFIVEILMKHLNLIGGQ